MKITDVLTACDLNPDYYNFIPIFIKAWKTLFPDINIHIILISSKLIDELKPYAEYIKLFPPLKGISTAFIAQTIRVLYPAILDKTAGGIIITDMDMVPMGRKYYTEQIKDFDSSKFICYRPLDCVGVNQMVMCYNIAHYNIWSDIFKIKTKNDIVKTLQNIYNITDYENTHGGIGWCTDQMYLYRATQDWNKETNSLIILKEDIFVIRDNNVKLQDNYYVRLWQFYNIDTIKYFLEHDKIVDYHMPRPYNKNTSDNIVELL